jgi:hypothetical protein
MTLLALGLLLYACGAFLQIAEEWPARGLSDTSYQALTFLVLGPGLIAAWAWESQHPALVTVTALPAALAGVGIALKARDTARTWRHHLRMRRR